MSFAEFLVDMAKEERRSEQREPAMAAELLVDHQREYAEFLKGCPFKVGDIVTPRANSITTNSGKVHVVLELRSANPPDFHGEVGTVEYGRRHDMRVAAFYGDTIARHWVESIDFEPFKRDA